MGVYIGKQPDNKKFPSTEEQDQESPEYQGMHPARTTLLKELGLPKCDTQSGENSF